MGSSARKKKEKKADFTKQKLRVGKARPKATNFTDTTFKSKSIALPTQSLHSTTPTASIQLTNHLSHLRSGTSSQRPDHLAALTAHLTATTPLTIPFSALLGVLNPLVGDPDNRIRSQLLKTYRLLPVAEISDGIEKLLPHIRASMSALSPDIKSTSLELLAWILDTRISLRAVSCAGGWIKTLKNLTTTLGWPVNTQAKPKSEWSSSATTVMPPGLKVKALGTLAAFLRAGLLPPEPVMGRPQTQWEERVWPFPLRNTEAHMLPRTPNPFGHLNIFGAPRDEEGEMYEETGERRRVFANLGYQDAIRKGVDDAKKEGGEVGRAAGLVQKVLKEADVENCGLA